MRCSPSISKGLWMAAVVVFSATSLVPSLRAVGGPLAPINLKCEYLTNPIGIDVRLPRFGWVDRHTDRAQAQSAYQLLVASSPELLAQDKGDEWDSAKAASDDSTQVVYNGKPLKSDHSYFW